MATLVSPGVSVTVTDESNYAPNQLGSVAYILVATATKVANALTAGTGLSGSNFDGSTAVTWTLNTATLMASAVNITNTASTLVGYSANIAGGAAGNIVYQSAASTTALLANGTAGQLLLQGVTNPAWTSTSSIGVGFVGNALTAGTGLSASGVFDGSVARTFSLNTATYMASAAVATSANKVANALTAEIGRAHV